MAKLYFEKLSHLTSELDIASKVDSVIQIKHFFSGAALYANGKICASWSPGGLAFKLPKSEVESLIGKGEAKPLKYFDKGRVKEGYAMFETPESYDKSHWVSYFIQAIESTSLDTK